MSINVNSFSYDSPVAELTRLAHKAGFTPVCRWHIDQALDLPVGSARGKVYSIPVAAEGRQQVIDYFENGGNSTVAVAAANAAREIFFHEQKVAREKNKPQRAARASSNRDIRLAAQPKKGSSNAAAPASGNKKGKGGKRK